MEYLDLYDEKCKRIGKTILRGSEIPDKCYIMITIIFIENSNHEYLFQLTSKEKGGVWATTGGHVKSGDDSFNTILREVEEELGYELNPERIKLIHRGMSNGRIFDVYYIKEDIDIEKLTLQKEEVDQVKWLSKKDIEALVKEGLIRLSNVKIMNDLGLIKD